MKRRAYMSVAMACLLLASGCTDDLIEKKINVNTDSDSGAIVFSNGANTRADEAARTPAAIPYVMVSADLDKGEGKSTYFYNYQFDRVGSEGNYLYKSSRNPIWPPEGTLKFKAYYPALQEMYDANYTWEGAVPSPTIDGNLVIHNFAIAKNNAYPVDLLTATPSVDVETFDTKKSVELNLKHQLTSIDIRAFNGSKTTATTDPETNIVTTEWGHIIEIAGIRIKNIPMVGDFDLNSSEWIREKTQTGTLEYIFQPNDKVLKLGRLGEHFNLIAAGTHAYTFYYNQYDTKDKAADLLNICGMEPITMLPTAALPEGNEDVEGKEIELQLLIRIIQDSNAKDAIKKYIAIYPKDIGYRYNEEKKYYLQDDGIRYIQSDRDDCALDATHGNYRDVKTEPILLKDDKIENIMEYVVEEREEGPGDEGKTFIYEEDDGNLNNITIPDIPDGHIIKYFRIMESAQHYGNGDNYFDKDEISQLRNTKPYNYGDGGRIPIGCIRRFAWINIPLTVKDKDGNEVKVACEAGKKYTWNLDFTNSLKNVTQLAPPDPNEEPEEIDPKELGKFAIELNVTVSDWEEGSEETLPAIGSYDPTPTAE